jgi:hypothetical protein
MPGFADATTLLNQRITGRYQGQAVQLLGEALLIGLGGGSSEALPKLGHFLFARTAAADFRGTAVSRHEMGSFSKLQILRQVVRA